MCVATENGSPRASYCVWGRFRLSATSLVFGQAVVWETVVAILRKNGQNPYMMYKSRKKRMPSYGSGGSVTDLKEQELIKKAAEEAKKAAAVLPKPTYAPGTRVKLNPSNTNVYRDAYGNYITNEDYTTPKKPVSVNPTTGKTSVKKIYAKGGKISVPTQTFDSFMRGK